MTLLKKLEDSINAAALAPQDAAAAQLARTYANVLDVAVGKNDSKTIAEVGSKLHALLKDMGMISAAKAPQKEGSTHDDAASIFEQLRSSFN